MRTKFWTGALLVWLGAMMSNAVVQGEEGWNGSLNQGYQYNLQNTSQAKWQEYYAKPDGFLLDGKLGYEGSDLLFDLGWGAKSASDLNANLGLEIQKNLTVEMDYLQYQHLFSNNGRSLFTEVAPELFLVPASLQLANYGAASTITYQNYLKQEFGTTGYALPVTVGLEDHSFKSKVSYQLAKDFGVEVNIDQKDRSGSKPLMVGGTPFQLPQRLDEHTTQGNFTAEYDGKDFCLRAGYDLSVYENYFPSLIASNPVVPFDTPTLSHVFQLGLSPSNFANHVNFSAESDAIPNTRVVADCALGWNQQNQAFLPYTVNPAQQPVTNSLGQVVVPNQLSSLPALALNGLETTLMQNYVITTRPDKTLVLSVRFRDYEMTNKNPQLYFTGYSVMDGTFAAKSGNGPGGVGFYNYNLGYVDQSLQGTARWQALKEVALNAKYTLDWMNHLDRAVQASEEDIARGGIELTPLREVKLSCDYTWAHRVAGQESWLTDYLADNIGQTGGFASMPGFRQYDIANRLKEDVTAKVTLTPLKTLFFSAAWSNGTDKYEPGSESLNANNAALIVQQYGLLNDQRDSWTFTANWQALDGVDLNGTVNQEEYDSTQTNAASRNQTTAALWQLDMKESSMYLDFGGTLELTDQISVNADWSLAHSTVSYNFPVDPNSGGGVTAVGLPDNYDRMEDYKVGVGYKINDTWSLHADYIYEIYGESDFQNDPLTTNPVGVNTLTQATTGLFLGIGNSPYTAQVGLITVAAKL